MQPATLESLQRQLTHLRQTFGKMELAMDSVTQAIVWTNNQGQIEWCNGRFDALIGQLHLYILGKKLTEILPLFLNGTAVEDSKHPLNLVVKEGQRVNEIYKFETKEGDWLSLEISGRPFTPNTFGTSAVFTLTDVTEKRKMEARLLNSQKLESVGSLAAGIAHELNTPIQYVADNLRFLAEEVKGYHDFIERFYQTFSEETTCPTEQALMEFKEVGKSIDFEFLREEVPRAIEQSLEGAAQVARIVSSVKAFSHPGSTEMAFSNMNAAVENAVNVSRNEWKYAANLELNLDKSIPEVKCNLGEMNQVFLNLIVNAAHAVDDANKATGSTEKGKIIVSTKVEGDEFVYSVQDSGTGIPENIRKRLFDPFFTTKPPGRGTGQGLHIAHEVVVSNHSGSIDFETELGKGTTFIVRLPIKGVKSPSNN